MRHWRYFDATDCYLNFPSLRRWENISPPGTNSRTMYKLLLSWTRRKSDLCTHVFNNLLGTVNVLCDTLRLSLHILTIEVFYYCTKTFLPCWLPRDKVSYSFHVGKENHSTDNSHVINLQSYSLQNHCFKGPFEEYIDRVYDSDQQVTGQGWAVSHLEVVL